MLPFRKAVLVVLALWTAANLDWSILLATRHHAERPSASADSAPHAVPPSPRRTLTLPADAREAVLAEMRVMLQSIQGVPEAGARGDSAGVRAAARTAGMEMAADPHLEALLPADWMALALDTHRAFDSLPTAGPEAAAILGRLGQLTGRCNACHAMYRLESR